MDLSPIVRTVLLALALLAGSVPRRAAPTAALAAPPGCQFGNGFAALRNAIGPEMVGECFEDEHAAADGAGTIQRTTRGAFAWRQADNVATFTDGGTTWIGRTNGLFRRANGERFAWEEDARASGLPLRYQGDVAVPETAQHPAYVLYTPDAALPPGKTFDAVLVLHGMGLNGPTMAAPLLQRARDRQLAVIAPTFSYGDWSSPTVARDEELRIPPRIAALLATIGDEAQVPVSGRVFVLGFSRGGQEATRLAFFRPERVRAVASFSAGTYTLPANTVRGPNGQPLAAPLPFGVSDLLERSGRPLDLATINRIPFLIGVGENDRAAGDVPRQWDPYIGTSRLERAHRFTGALVQAGIPGFLAIFPNAGHELNGAMLDQAFGFFDNARTT